MQKNFLTPYERYNRNNTLVNVRKSNDPENSRLLLSNKTGGGLNTTDFRLLLDQ